MIANKGQILRSMFCNPRDGIRLANDAFVQTFGKGRSKAAAFKEVIAPITNKKLSDREPLLIDPQVVKLSFSGEDKIVHWELLAFNNDDIEFCEESLEADQSFFILTV